MAYFCTSWSGGKDAALATYLYQQQGHTLCAVITLMQEDGVYSRAHLAHQSLFDCQAKALKVPLIAECVTEDYACAYQKALSQAQKIESKLNTVILGDIDLQAHKDWQSQQAQRSGLIAEFPLWQQAHSAIIQQLNALGFRMQIIAIQSERLSDDFLGRELNTECIEALEALNIDPCAESGEFHTAVIAAPNFAFEIQLHCDYAGIYSGEYGMRYLPFKAECVNG